MKLPEFNNSDPLYSFIFLFCGEYFDVHKLLGTIFAFLDSGTKRSKNFSESKTFEIL